MFAFPRQELIDYALKLPGSRNLEEPYGVNLVGFAVPEGNAGRLAYVSELLEEVKSSGTIQRMIVGGELPGFRVVRATNIAKWCSWQEAAIFWASRIVAVSRFGLHRATSGHQTR